MLTEHHLGVLTASDGKRVTLTCVDGDTVEGAVVWVSAEDVLLDAIRQPDGRLSYESVLSVKFVDIASVSAVG